MHVSGANLEDVHFLKQGKLIDVHHFADDGKACFPLGFHQHGKALGPQSLERIGGGSRLEGPAPQNLGPGGLDRVGYL